MLLNTFCLFVFLALTFVLEKLCPGFEVCIKMDDAGANSDATYLSFPIKADYK